MQKKYSGLIGHIGHIPSRLPVVLHELLCLAAVVLVPLLGVLHQLPLSLLRPLDILIQNRRIQGSMSIVPNYTKLVSLVLIDMVHNFFHK